MRVYLLSILILFTSCKGFEVIPNPVPVEGQEDFGSDVSTITPEMGGSNYAFIDLGRYATDPSSENWASDVKTFAVHFEQHIPRVRIQLQEMIRNGQKKISLPIWFNGPGTNCDVYLHTVCPQEGKVPESVKRNIVGMINEVLKKPFKEMQIRFAAQGPADVYGWTQFEENIYASSKSFILDAIRIVEEATQGKNVKVYYDLGLEMMGHPYVKDHTWHREYLRRLWAAYLTLYPLEKTIGFSFNHAHRDGMYESLKIFDDSGKRPPRLGFDIYADRGDHFQNIQWILDLKGWGRAYPIFIQETFRNDSQIAQEVLDARNNLGLNIITIMQWPLDQGGNGHSNSVDYSFDNYK